MYMGVTAAAAWLTLVLLMYQPRTQCKPRQREIITVNNFVMLSQRKLVRQTKKKKLDDVKHRKNIEGLLDGNETKRGDNQRVM